MSQQALAQVLRGLPLPKNENVLVNSTTADDAGVYRLDRHRALVQTVDFFTPIVDDPAAYGRIAAANALSDIFAMGGQPLTALNVMGFPTGLVSPGTITAILRGALAKATEAGCAIIGGHSIRSPEPIFGLAVTGIVDTAHMMINAAARPGDVLVLTKPLGTGIATTAMKRSIASRALASKTIRLMAAINSVGFALARNRLVHAATDITGFGLMGHLAAMCRASGVSAQVEAKNVAAISPEIMKLIAQGCIPGGTKDNVQFAGKTVSWNNLPQANRVLMCDAQTSGGLLLAVRPKRLNAVLALLQKARVGRTLIGRITERKAHLICIDV